MLAPHPQPVDVPHPNREERDRQFHLPWGANRVHTLPPLDGYEHNYPTAEAQTLSQALEDFRQQAADWVAANQAQFDAWVAEAASAAN